MRNLLLLSNVHSHKALEGGVSCIECILFHDCVSKTLCARPKGSTGKNESNCQTDSYGIIPSTPCALANLQVGDWGMNNQTQISLEFSSIVSRNLVDFGIPPPIRRIFGRHQHWFIAMRISLLPNRYPSTFVKRDPHAKWDNVSNVVCQRFDLFHIHVFVGRHMSSGFVVEQNLGCWFWGFWFLSDTWFGHAKFKTMKKTTGLHHNPQVGTTTNPQLSWLRMRRELHLIDYISCPCPNMVALLPSRTLFLIFWREMVVVWQCIWCGSEKCISIA